MPAYCRFTWWIKLYITQLQRTICDQKFGLKLQFVHNQNKVQFCPQMLHFAQKNSKLFRGETPEPPLWEEATPSCIYLLTPEHGLRLHPSLTPPPLSSTFRGLWSHLSENIVKQALWTVFSDAVCIVCSVVSSLQDMFVLFHHVCCPIGVGNDDDNDDDKWFFMLGD